MHSRTADLSKEVTGYFSRTGALFQVHSVDVCGGSVAQDASFWGVVFCRCCFVVAVGVRVSDEG